MKKFILAIMVLFVFTINLKAQEIKSGAIQFISIFDPAAMAEANGIKLNAEMMARMRTVKMPFELLFNATNASYMKVDETEDSNTEGNNRGGFRMTGFGASSNRDYFYNFPSHKLTAVFDVRDTTYFMDAPLGVADLPQSMGNRTAALPPTVEFVKMDETKKILGFTCHKIIVKTTTKRKIEGVDKEIIMETAVWYTKDLGFDFSPNPSMWTEGAVLAIEGKGINVLANSIEYRKVSAKDVNLPKKGIVITPEAYKAKMDALMKNRRVGQGNNSGNAIRNIVIN